MTFQNNSLSEDYVSSTETALVKVSNDPLLASDRGLLSCYLLNWILALHLIHLFIISCYKDLSNYLELQEQPLAGLNYISQIDLSLYMSMISLLLPPRLTMLLLKILCLD